MKTYTQVPHGDIKAATDRLWVAVGEHAEEVATRVNSDQAFVANIARLMINGGFEPSTSQKLAREIMGKNFFGIEEAIRHFGVSFSKRQLNYLEEIPFGEDVLRACKDTHVLVAVAKLSILDIRGIVKKLVDKTIFYNQDWYDNEPVAKDKGEISWQLVRKTIVADSTSKTWDEQLALLDKNEEVAQERILIYTMVGHFLSTGERLFEKVYARCVELGSVGFRMLVGFFGGAGFHLHCWCDGRRYDFIGLAACRKQ